MDATPDVSKVDLLSQVYCYVRVIRDANNVATDLTITESFWSFLETADTSTAELQHKILGSIEENGLDISKCGGQGYDGAANISGVYSGVPARISEKEQLAVYVRRVQF